MRTLGVVAVVLLAGCSSGTSTNTGGGTGGSGDGGVGGGSGGSAGGGTGGTGGSGGGAAGVALGDYCAKLAEATCASGKRCGAVAPNADCAKVALPTRFSLINGRVDCLFVDLRTALDAGTATYHPDKAAACLAADTSCNPNVRFLASADCAAVVTGTRANGASCRNSAECITGHYCDSSASVCPGTCKPRVPAGAFASSSTAGGLTASGSCAAQTIYMGQSDGGATCQAIVGPGGDCTPPPGAFFGKLCSGDEVCGPATDAGVRNCKPPKPAGSACGPFDENCAPGTTCGPGDGGTQCVPLRRLGESCFGMGLGIPCQTGLSCTNGVCAPLVAANGACFDDADCVAGHVCGTGQVCRPFGTLGAACNTANLQDDCALGFYCSKTTAMCATKLGRSAPCADGLGCDNERGFFCENTTTDGGVRRCEPVACINP